MQTRSTVLMNTIQMVKYQAGSGPSFRTVSRVSEALRPVFNFTVRLVIHLRSFCSGLITRFLPAIEAFFMVNSSFLSDETVAGASEDSDDNRRVVQFAAGNKILL
jgi:hypothetical protein